MEVLKFVFLLLPHVATGLIGTEAPRMISVSSHLKLTEGDTIELPCNLENIDRFVRIWKQLPSRVLFSGSIAVSRDGHLKLGNDGSLRLEKVTPEYEAEYLCQVHQHPELRVTHRIQVLVPPAVAPDPANGKVIVRRDNPASVFCNASGSPAPAVTWTYERDGQTRTTLPSGVRVVEGGTHLQISSADILHVGLYRCTVENGVGPPVTVPFTITVLYSPDVKVLPDWIHGDTGATVEFTCTSEATPISLITWFKGGAKQGPIIQSNSKITLKDISISNTVTGTSLRIQRLIRDDLGSYTCLAKNSVGESWKTVEISGLAEAVHLRGNQSGESSYTLLWTTKSYSRIIEYQLKLRKHKGGPDWTTVMIPEGATGEGILYSQSYEVTGLEPGAPYEAIVLAHNDFGWNRPPHAFFFHTGSLLAITEEEDDYETTEAPPLPLYDAILEITDSTSLKQDSATSSCNSSYILLHFFILVIFIF